MNWYWARETEDHTHAETSFDMLEISQTGGQIQTDGSNTV